MAFAGLNVLAVVPARGGSKGIPRKNLQPVCGLSLLGHAARVVRALPWVDLGILSTDDEEIAAEGSRHGLMAPFRRPASLASDTATSIDMWRHAWLSSEDHADQRFDISILLEPTSPMRTPADVEGTIRLLVDGGHAAAATVSRNPAHFTPEKTLLVDAEGRIGHYLGTHARARRQDIPPYYHRNGICYAVRRDTLIDKGEIIGADCAAFVVDREIVNIDDPFELELAEWLIRREGWQG